MVIEISYGTIRGKMFPCMKIIFSFRSKGVWKNDTKRLDELGDSSP